jgi:hypothetical protein
MPLNFNELLCRKFVRQVTKDSPLFVLARLGITQTVLVNHCLGAGIDDSKEYRGVQM